MAKQVKGYIAKNGGTLSSAFKQAFNQIKQSDFARKVSETYLTRIVLMCLGLVSSIVVARTLGPEGRGLFAVAMTVATLGIQFGNLGLHASNTYYVSKNRKLLPVLIGNSLRLSFLVGGGGGFLCWIVFRLFPQISPITGPILIFALIWVPIGLAYLLFQNLLIGVHDIRAFNKIELGGRVFSLLCVFAAVYFLRPSPIPVYLACLAGTVLCFFWSYSALGRHLKEKPSFSGEVFRRTSYYGFKAYINAFFAFLVLKVDLLMVKYFLGAEQTGHYSIASSMADMLYLLPSIVGSILFPKLASRKTARDKWNLSQKAMTALFFLMIPLASIAALLANPAVRILYGPEYLPAVPAFWILCVSMVFYAANNAISYYFASVGFPWFSVYVWIIVSFLNITLNLFLIPCYGIKGAALASLACYSFVFFLQYFYVLLRGPRVESRT